MASGQEEQADRREPSSRGQGFVVARLFGIPVYVSPYWFIIAGVFIVIYANDLSSALSGSTRYVVAAAFVVLLYLSVLVHELSHSVVARGYGLPVRRILLYPLGGVSEIEREAPTPFREFAVAGAGPALSLALGAVGWGLAQLAPYGVTGALIRQLMVANIIVGVFNLLPGLPLDGGRMLRAVIWKITKKPATATIAAAWVGRVLALALLAIPFFSGGLAGGDIVSTLWVVVIAGVHVDGREPVDQGHQVPRAAARPPGPPPGPQGHLGAREHPAGRGDQAGRRGRRPRGGRGRPRQQADRDRQRGRRHGDAAAAQALGGRRLDGQDASIRASYSTPTCRAWRCSTRYAAPRPRSTCSSTRRARSSASSPPATSTRSSPECDVWHRARRLRPGRQHVNSAPGVKKTRARRSFPSRRTESSR